MPSHSRQRRGSIVAERVGAALRPAPAVVVGHPREPRERLWNALGEGRGGAFEVSLARWHDAGGWQVRGSSGVSLLEDVAIERWVVFALPWWRARLDRVDHVGPQRLDQQAADVFDTGEWHADADAVGERRQVPGLLDDLGSRGPERTHRVAAQRLLVGVDAKQALPR